MNGFLYQTHHDYKPIGLKFMISVVGEVVFYIEYRSDDKSAKIDVSYQGHFFSNVMRLCNVD